jgi:hypothetical protein
MNTTKPSPVVLVRMRESTVALLLARQLCKDEALDAVIARLACTGSPEPKPPIVLTPMPRIGVSARASQEYDKYGLELFGATLRASTLGRLFGALIDKLFELDTKAVEKISTIRATKRGYVSREKNVIHPGRPDLPLLKTRSGWWISANIGTDDLERALRCACEVNGLVYGRDIRFLGRQKGDPLAEPQMGQRLLSAQRLVRR